MTYDSLDGSNVQNAVLVILVREECAVNGTCLLRIPSLGAGTVSLKILWAIR